MKKSRKLAFFAGALVVLLVAGFWGFTSLNGATTDVDASKLATVERGTMVKSVVATGKIEPITKVEIKSKANGIIEKLYVDVDQVVDAGAVLAELDKEQLRARVRELEANLLAKRASLEGARGAAQEEPHRGRVARRRVRAAQLRPRPESLRTEAPRAVGARRCEERTRGRARTASAPRRGSSSSARRA